MPLADTLAAPVVRPVHVGLLDFSGAPLRGWNGPGAFAPTGTGDTDLDGFTFIEAEGAINISDFTQDSGIGGPLTISFSAGNFDDEAVVQEIVMDRRVYMGRKAKIWLFFLNSTESAALSDYAVLFSGVMVSVQSTRQPGQPAIISVACDQDLQKAKTAPVRLIDHSFWYPSDTASTFLNDLNRAPIAGAHAPMGPSPTPYPVPPGVGSAGGGAPWDYSHWGLP